MRFKKSQTDNASGFNGSLSQTLAMAGQQQLQHAKTKDPADWKKILLITGLGSLSWISTYTGMLELIQANMGEISLVYKGAIAFAVAMLMLMIIWILDALFSRISMPVRVIFTFGYIFLTLISIGFGFGFYWKFLESRSEATRSAESAVTNVQSALLSAQTRLEQLQVTLATLTSLSLTKAIAEREKGNSCPNSRPGDGPRRRLRDADAQNFKYAGEFVSTRVGTVKNDIGILAKDLKLVSSRAKSTIDAKTGTRNLFLRDLNQKLNNSVVRFNAFRTDPQLQQYRNSFAERSSQTIFPNGKGGKFTCPDPQLQAALRGVVLAIDQLPSLEKPKIAAVEGSEAIIEAFRRMTVTIIGAISFKMPPSPDELRALQQRAVQSVENVAVQRQIMSRQAGLGDRDYIPLSIAVFVDFCLLLVSMSRPMHGFRGLEKKMFEAEEWPIIQILARFKDIHSDEDIRETFEIFRHVVFDYMGDYYVGVPLKAPLDAPDREDAQREAHLLGNLFTSFEKEGIFKRVLWPNNAIARNRLERQDSKFAGSETFRIYRFRDGAWSDWVLGAIMGAAKRVEAEKQKKQFESELFASNSAEPKFSSTNHTQPASGPEQVPHASYAPHVNYNNGAINSQAMNGSNVNGANMNGSEKYPGTNYNETGYTNVEPLYPVPPRPRHDLNNTETFSAPQGPPPYGQQTEIRANGTNGGLNQRLNNHLNTPEPDSTTVHTQPPTPPSTEVHSLWSDEPQADIINLSDASSYISNVNSPAIPPATDTNVVKSIDASNNDGTIRLRRETVEIDQSTLTAINNNQNGGNFMSALTDALNPANIEQSNQNAILEKIEPPIMPDIPTALEPGITETINLFLHDEHEINPTNPPQNNDVENIADTPIITPPLSQTAEPETYDYAEEWDEEDLQIENITRWYSRQDQDPKLN